MPDQDKDARTPQSEKTEGDDAIVEESGAGYGNNAGSQGDDGEGDRDEG